MYVILEDGWRLLRSTHETRTPEGWVQTQDLRIGDTVLSPASRRQVKVVGFT